MSHLPSVRSNILRWIKALRSGKYRQCRKVLHSPKGGYCCLGVALEVRGVEWGEGRAADRANELPAALNPSDNADSLCSLNEANRKLFGLSDGDEGELIALNDEDQRQFPFIASYIEREILPHYPVKRRSRPSRVRSGGR